MDVIKENERKAEELRSEDEVMDVRKSIAEKKAAEAEAKRLYGRDWRKMIGNVFRKAKVNQDALMSLHSMGVGGQELRDLNNPAYLRRRR